MQHMYRNIPHMFDCWANPVVHLFLLKSSIAYQSYVQANTTTLFALPNLH